MKQNNFKLPILLYDDQCPLCKRFSDSLTRIETIPINKISIHNHKIYEHFPDLSKEKCNQDVHYITEDKKILIGSVVIDHLIRQYPVVKKFSWLMDSKMGQKSIDLFYSASSRLRKNLLTCKRCLK